MISFDLKCRVQGHVFEGWFGSAEAYRDQLARGLVTCPQCGSGDIEKLLSVPNVGAKSNQQVNVSVEVPESHPPAPMMSAPASPPEAIPPVVREMMARVVEAQAKALKSSEWVGDKFVEEVRAQHYGETDVRPVHGEANARQAEELAEEGIGVMPILFPIAPPKKRN